MGAMFVCCIDFTNQLESTRKHFTSFGIGAVVILTSVQNDICLNLFHSIFDNGNDKKVVVYMLLQIPPLATAQEHTLPGTVAVRVQFV